MMNRDRAKELQDVFNHFADGGEVEYRIDGVWVLSDEIVGTEPYRIAVTKPSIDWSHVHEDYKWLATDMGSNTTFFAEKPEVSKCHWNGNCGRAVLHPEGFSSFKPGTCDWKDSLVERPE